MGTGLFLDKRDCVERTKQNTGYACIDLTSSGWNRGLVKHVLKAERESLSATVKIDDGSKCREVTYK